MGSISPEDTFGKRLSLVEWLNSLFPGLDIPLEASEEELRVILFDGTVLWGILNKHDASSLPNQRGAYMSSEHRREMVRKFLSAIEAMGLPSFTAGDLEHGSISTVVDCLLSLRDRLSFGYSEGDVHVTANSGKQEREKWIKSENFGDAMDASQESLVQMGKKSPLRDEKERNFSEPRFERILHIPVIPVASESCLMQVDVYLVSAAQD